MKKFLSYTLLIFCCFFVAVLFGVIIATGLNIIAHIPTATGQAFGLLGLVLLLSLIAAGIVCASER